ncbi:aminotransferase class III-fold pyridoxal phosphate-dependent enzyme, partial [Francisella tularensis subsp. holarctica]|uniref:aminotransferase class III-fold pyridoxal phosphate-dependent enzyme n=1 Tax=Francisella tularensis TaxID=263 RepID=UPI002381B474
LGQPYCAGLPVYVVKDSLVASCNDMDSSQALFEKYKDEIACIIVETIAGNMNMIFQQDGFLAKRRAICDQYRSLLI